MFQFHLSVSLSLSKMDLFLSLPTIFLLIFICFPMGRPFTVIMSDSSALVDTPQTGFSANSNGARTDSREQEAVYDIMRATGNSWATDIPDVCRGRWHGIECMPDKDNVFHIVSLSFGALSDDTAFPTCDPTQSIISPSITKLPHIRTLFFYRCFSDNPQPIPNFLGQLGPTLQTLVLRENGHVGPIPNELGNLTRLKVLDLHKNNLNGSIPISLGRLTGLKSLDLSGNKLTGSIPALSFPVLNVLDLNQNHLLGSIPSTLGSFQNLIKLDLSRNRLSGPIPNSINGLKNLVLLDLSYNCLSSPLPLSLKTMNSLQALVLKGNPMDSTTIPNDGFDGLKDLMILVLSDMNLNGKIPDSLGRLTNLRVLHLDGNHLNGSIPASFRDLNNLSELRLNNNWLTGPVPFRREMVWRMKRKLRLYNNSGLCYDVNDGFADSFDSSFDLGIGYCETPNPGSARTVQHLSASIEDMDRSLNKSSSVIHKVPLLELVTILLFVLFLLSE
ncbi:Protein TOO MANY MOUTHS [Camellia lanceoleosa]|uniref:Protein TOO MANY MOUTHS n=1 Tax=Camellia lanceoleosa TaxID=1840588 RepID=A0ACC0FFK1_9ERIC|nr:Protein TOO MANY MOUTHS [Camellia lanceoleosa]